MAVNIRRTMCSKFSLSIAALGGALRETPSVQSVWWGLKLIDAVNFFDMRRDASDSCYCSADSGLAQPFS